MSTSSPVRRGAAGFAPHHHLGGWAPSPRPLLTADRSANLDSRRVDYTLLSLLRTVFLERSVSTCRAMEQIIIYWHNPGVNLLFCTWSYMRAALAALIWSRFCARTALSGLRGRPTGPDGSHSVLMPPPSLGGGGSGGGSRGGPVGSFARTSLSHSSLQRHAPVPKSMQLVHSILSISIYQRLSSTITTDHCQSSLESTRTLSTCHGWIHHAFT